MKRVALTFWISFSILFGCLNCQKPVQTPRISVVSKNQKAVGLSIHGISINKSEISDRLQVQLVKEGERSSVLGEFKVDRDEVIFEPLVPLTDGLQYAVLLDDSLIGEIKVPAGNYSSPKLLSIYPTQDTLPENLLKLYLEFSAAMVEGRSLDFIALIRNDGDTMKGTFLALQPELWNKEGTVLTLWLDPGRIKRDLIPNKELGAPLNAWENYTLHVSRSWRSKNGSPLSQNYEKKFVTTSRDEASPALVKWKIIPPSEGMEALEVRVPEPLDYFLFKDGLQIVDASGAVIAGGAQVTDEERIYKFVPENPWKKGDYSLKIEAKLEDLAGNNLNRPFDRVVGSESGEREEKNFTREFEIR